MMRRFLFEKDKVSSYDLCEFEKYLAIKKKQGKIIDFSTDDIQDYKLYYVFGEENSVLQNDIMRFLQNFLKVVQVGYKDIG